MKKYRLEISSESTPESSPKSSPESSPDISHFGLTQLKSQFLVKAKFRLKFHLHILPDHNFTIHLKILICKESFFNVLTKFNNIWRLNIHIKIGLNVFFNEASCNARLILKKFHMAFETF